MLIHIIDPDEIDEHSRCDRCGAPAQEPDPALHGWGMALCLTCAMEACPAEGARILQEEIER